MELPINSPKHGKRIILFDDEDADLILSYSWCIWKMRDIFYAKSGLFMMHRLIISVPDNLLVDHRDGNGLNNQKSNLRTATIAQNLMNRGANKNNTSGFKGVFWHEGAKKYMVQIKIGRRIIYGGLFSEVINAARRYNELAVIHHGDFAKLNPIPS